MSENRKKILIVGENSYLATGLTFDDREYDVDKIRRPFELNKQNEYKKYDYIINFCIQPEHFTKILDESELIDVNIARNITKDSTKLVFLSSRKVYGYNTDLKEYKEENFIKPFDFYSINKTNIEKFLQKYIPNNCIILRTGNIIDFPPDKENYKTFIGWIQSELYKKNKVFCTVKKDTRKDFITRDYFQKALKGLVNDDSTGIFNVGANFALTIEEILFNLLPTEYVDYTNANNDSDQFILNTTKLQKIVPSFKKEELLTKCLEIKNSLNLDVSKREQA